MIQISSFPECTKCNKGKMLPFEDTSRNEQVAYLKAWICEECGHSIMLKNGEVVTDGKKSYLDC